MGAARSVGAVYAAGSRLWLVFLARARGAARPRFKRPARARAEPIKFACGSVQIDRHAAVIFDNLDRHSHSREAVQRIKVWKQTRLPLWR